MAIANGIVLAQQVQGIEEIDTSKYLGNHQLHHKIDMINQLLKSPTLTAKLRKRGNPSAEELVVRAKVNYQKVETYLKNQQYVEAGAVIDFILRDITASARIINVPEQQSKEYKQSIRKLEYFVLPEWKNLNEEDEKYLQDTQEKIAELKNFAIEKAQSESWSEAIELMETAYDLKTHLIAMLPHENTVIYDLTFESVEDEYKYLNSRTYHFLELVDLAMVKNEPSEQTIKLANKYVSLSKVSLEVAEGLELEGQYDEAIELLNKAISRLSTVLKILGVKI
ncbi:MAG: hypothetical protein HKN34_09280 [Gammaproteobacteria bacterium]|nr:hypothetical protein [Gammaproteobacteria bacterium]